MKQCENELFKSKMGLGLLLLTMTVTTSSCLNIGPYVMEIERLKYNTAITRTDSQEILLNLVRVKYLDPASVLAVVNINSQLTLSTTAEAAYNEADNRFTRLSNRFSAFLRGTYEDKPTITYQPLQGEKFVKNLLSQIPLESLEILYDSGWSVERLFRLCVQEINDIRNAPSASGPTPQFAPEFIDFIKLTKLMRTLQKLNVMDIDYTLVEDKPVLAFKFAKDALTLSETLQIKEMLRLAPEKRVYPLIINEMDHDPNFITIRTRSVKGVFYYLSQNVEIPEKDIKRRKVTTTQYQDGRPFDWKELLGDLLNIKMSKRKPSIDLDFGQTPPLSA